MTVAIIGAGMAGLSAAAHLKARSVETLLFDKARGPGGRMSTRRMQTPLGEVRWDHGAQFFTARDPGFQSLIETCREAGTVDTWNGPFTDKVQEPRYVGTPGMNDVIRSMAKSHSVQWARHVTQITGVSGAWKLIFADGTEAGPFDAILSSVPAEQAGPLFEIIAPELAAQAYGARTAPCWAALLAFDAPIDQPSGRLKEHPCLAWVGRNKTKPGRGPHEAWVLHARPDWSKDELEEAPETIAQTLTDAFCDLNGAPAPVFQTAHRWRYAQVQSASAQQAEWDSALRLGTCGDWHIGPRVEAAWLSGRHLAECYLSGR